MNSLLSTILIILSYYLSQTYNSIDIVMYSVYYCVYLVCIILLQIWLPYCLIGTWVSDCQLSCSCLSILICSLRIANSMNLMICQWYHIFIFLGFYSHKYVYACLCQSIYLSYCFFYYLSLMFDCISEWMQVWMF